MGLLIGILGMAAFILFAYGMQWLVKKFFGTTVIGHGQFKSSLRKENQKRNIISLEEQKLVDKAVMECEKKGYAKTVDNIYDELFKIKRKRRK